MKIIQIVSAGVTDADYVTVNLMTANCNETFPIDDVVSIPEQYTNFTNNETVEYYIDIDTTKISGNSLVSFEEGFEVTQVKGDIYFCVQVETFLSVIPTDLAVTRREFEFDLRFDLTVKNFTDQFSLVEAAVTNVTESIIDDFNITVCRCDQSFNCLSENVDVLEESPFVDICIIPQDSIVSVANYELYLGNQGYTYAAVIQDADGPFIVNDEITDVFTSGNAIRVRTIVVADLFDGFNGDFSVNVFGKADLRFVAKRLTSENVIEEFKFVLNVVPAVMQSVGEVETNCGNLLRSLLGRIIRRLN